MAQEPPPFELNVEELLRHDAWLRALVRGLVSDDRAADVLQQTWLAALQHPPREAGALRSWLARVATRRAMATRRAESDRRRHEIAARPPSVAESTEESLQRLEAQRAVTQAVLELPEPYRTAVVLRYDQQLSVAEIAQRTNTTEANTRQRVKRGLDQLRERLTAEYGADWRRHRGLALLATPIPLVADPGLPILFGALAMTKVRVFAVAALVLATGLLVWQVFGTDSSPSGAPPGGDPPVVAAPPRESGEATPSPAPPERSVLPTAPRIAADSPPQRGRVLDVHGRPVAGARVGVRPVSGDRLIGLGTTADDGSFEVESSIAGHDGVLVLEGNWTAVHTARLPHPVQHELLIIAAPALDLAGTVTEPSGQPIAGVRVRVWVGPMSDFPLSLEHTARPDRGSTETDQRGRFQLGDLPAGAAQLSFTVAGFEPVQRAIEATMPRPLHIQLHAIDAQRRIVTGVVTDHVHTPLVGASVGLGARRTFTDAFGRYRLELAPGDDPSRDAVLWAATPGLRTTSVPGFGTEVASCEQGVIERDLQFSGPVLEISGRVIGPGGRPIADVDVFPWGEEPLFEMRTAEDLAAPTGTQPLQLSGPEVFAYAHTGPEGRFLLTGLGDREYRLRILDRENGWGYTTAPIRAGRRDVDVRLPDNVLRDHLSGRAITPDGQPAPDLEISHLFGVWKSPFGQNWLFAPCDVRTDADGRFEMTDFPRFGVVLRFGGDDYITTELEITPTDPGTDLEVVVARRCLFRVTISDPAWAAGHMHVLDAAGKRLSMQIRLRSVSATASSQQLHDGKSPVLATSENAATVVITAGERELEIPVRLLPGEVNVIAR